jgi:glycyl-tRNA synthetase alpha chain
MEAQTLSARKDSRLASSANMLAPSQPLTFQPLTFQQLFFRLQTFWAERGCVLQQPFDSEVGAGTMSPETFLRVLGPKPVRLAYAQPSRRPADGRYGENPNRLYKHTQFQVILKPPPANVQDVYLASLAAIGIDLREHDLKFEEDNWEWPVGGAWGVGWQVMLDGLEITQFTYFQQCGGMDLDPITGEITYGLERIAAFLQDVDSIYDIVWARDPETGTAVTYGDMRLQEELQLSVYSFEAAEVEKLWEHLRLYEAECATLLASFRDAERLAGEHAKHHERLLDKENAKPPQELDLRRFPVLGAYELALKCSHLFNLLDARGAISVTERVAVMARIRTLVVGVARAYAAQGAQALKEGKTS